MALQATPPLEDRHGSRWPLLAAVALALAGVAAAAFFVLDPLGGSGGPERTRYSEAVVGTPSRVNPLFVHLNDVDRDIASLVYSGLTRLAKDGTPQPDLAESWDIENGGRRVTFHLDPRVTWQTGVTFTAEDVLFTFSLLADPALPGDPEQTTLWRSVRCTAPDPRTVSCDLPEPYAPFLTYASVGILPKHILGGATAASIVDDPFNRAPIGTGPYRLMQLNDERAVLRAYDRFYRGAPGIDEIELFFFPDISSAAAAVLRGEARGLLVDLSIDPTDFQTLQTLDGFTAHAAHRSAYTSLYLNNTEPPTDEHAVRAAIARTVDVDSIITSLLGGRGVRTDTPIVPGTWAFDPDASQRSRDLGEARALLDEAGWLLPEGSSVRERRGTELRLTLITDQDALRGAVADAIAAQLGSIGIGVTVVRQPSDDLVSEYLIPRQYQAAVFGWDPGADPDPYPAWHSSQTLNNGRNLAGYSNDEADALLEEARRSSDLDSRRDLYRDFHKIFLADAASVPLFCPLYSYITGAEVEGVDPGVLFFPSSRFRNVDEWRVGESPLLGD